MNTIEPTLIKKKELARRLSVSTRSIDTWVGKRMIPYIQITPRFYQPPFPRPPVRPNGCFTSIPPKANS